MPLLISLPRRTRTNLTVADGVNTTFRAETIFFWVDLRLDPTHITSNSFAFEVCVAIFTTSGEMIEKERVEFKKKELRKTRVTEESNKFNFKVG